MLNEKFNSWIVIERADNSNSGKKRYLCRCKCGTEKIVLSASLTGGKSKSCRSCSAKGIVGNVERLQATKGSTKHGMAGTRFYEIWINMKNRCSDLSNKDYGGRGISVCVEWYDFDNFYADMYATYTDNLTIDRVDNNKGYSKSNCVWSTMSEQARNTRRNHLIDYRGQTKTLIDWCEELNIPYGRTKKRIQDGCTTEVAFEKPKQKNQYK